uniref:Uncharacterized protein n=1 Tax=Chlamydomonas euryale TaxID=1486919 RepID=A0A7R9V9L7_9CHLO|mmetsp:Transcript_24330/g.72217  ORF Transcript_24330/g.72217 Transcript_24330/m.72217 type:complete len:507 (+) Transcript_24330:469-1989(+)
MAQLAELLARLESFMETRHNYIAPMGWEASVGGLIGLSLDQTRFMLALFLSVPTAAVVPRIPGSTLRHLYALLVGALLVYYPFGFGVIHAAAPCALVYLSMAVFPSVCGALAWGVCFPYLIYLHVVNASGENWQAGLLDFTGCEMVLVLKLISLAVARQDGWKLATRGEDLTDYQRVHCFNRCPNPLEYLSFVFGLGNLLSGPYLEYNDYQGFIQQRGLWDTKARKPPSSKAPALKCMATALVYMVLYQAMIPTFNRKLLVGEWYSQQSFFVKVFACHMTSLTSQVKFVFAWKISEASLTVAGLNFDGWDENTGEGKWGRYENVRFTKMLLSDSGRIVVSHWNVGTARFLRRYVYERILPKGRKPGFPQLLTTQVVSAVWHGLYPGYLLFFVGSAFWINFSTVIYHAERALLPQAVAKSVPMRAAKIVWTHVCLNTIATAFTVLDVKETLRLWRSIYFAPMLIIVVGSVAGPALLSLVRETKQRGADKGGSDSGVAGDGPMEKKKN